MKTVILLIVALLCGLAVSRAAAGQVTSNTSAETADGASPAGDGASPAGDVAGAALDAAAAINPAAIMDRNSLEDDQQETNIAAFLQMIAQAEGTADAADQYAVCYGYRHTVKNFADHPAITGEWRGEALDKLGPTYAGKVSTAAGRYQIIRPTWKGCKRALALPDFGPDSQDKAALFIIREAGALDFVRAGQFNEAVTACAGQWASLPGANAPGQAMRRLSDLRAAYEAAGGEFA